MAATQDAYEKAVDALFESLDRLEGVLKGKNFLVGNQLTEADVRLYPTIASRSLSCLFQRSQILQVRFDPVYFSLFKCNLRDIRHGYPEIHR